MLKNCYKILLHNYNDFVTKICYKYYIKFIYICKNIILNLFIYVKILY